MTRHSREWVAGTDERFAARIRQLRESKGHTQAEMAAKLTLLHGGHVGQWHQTRWSKVEAGERRVWLGEAMAIADVLGVDLSTLLDEHPIPDAHRVEVSAALTEARRIRGLVTERIDKLGSELGAEDASDA